MQTAQCSEEAVVYNLAAFRGAAQLTQLTRLAFARPDVGWRHRLYGRCCAAQPYAGMTLSQLILAFYSCCGPPRVDSLARWC